MIKIVEVHHPINNPDNYQCRVIEYESFEKYIEDLKQFKVSSSSGYSIPHTVNKNRTYFYINDNWLYVKYFRPLDDERLIHMAWVVNINC